MSTTLARPAAIFLLVVTLAGLLIAGMRPPESATPGTPVAGARESESVDRIVMLGMPSLAWSDIDDETPTLQNLADQATSGSVVLEHRTPVPCASEAWLSLGAVAVVPGSASAVSEIGEVGNDDGGAAEAETNQDCSSDVPPAVNSDDEGTTTLSLFDAWQEAWSRPPGQVSLGLLATGLRAEGQCLAAYGPSAALASSDRAGVLGRFDPSTLGDLNLARIVRGDRACPVTLIDGAGADLAQLDERVARLRELLPANSLLIVAGMPGGPDVGEDYQEATRPLFMLRTDPEGEEVQNAAGLWSASTNVPGVAQWTDLAATILANANVPLTSTMNGVPLNARTTQDGELATQNREFSAAITLADRAQTGFFMTWIVLIALALGAASAWLRFAPVGADEEGADHDTQQAGGPLSAVGLAIAALPVATLCASLLPWWRWGVDLESADVATAALFRPIVAMVLLTAIIGALIVAGAWAAYRLVGRHPLVPVGVIAAVTVIVIGADSATGGDLALRSVLGAHEITGARFYGLTSAPFGLFCTAVVVLAGCIASLFAVPVRLGRRVGVIAVVLLGLSAAMVIGSGDWGADPGGVPAIVVGTLLLAVAAAGRRLSPSVVFLLGIIAASVLGVIAFADWLRPEESRSTAGRIIQAIWTGDALAVLSSRLDRSAGVLLDAPSAWLIVALLALAAYAITARPTIAGGRLLPIWDQYLMRATGAALLGTWVIGWVLNDSGVAAVAAGLTIAYGAGLSIAALGRPVDSAPVTGPIRP